MRRKNISAFTAQMNATPKGSLAEGSAEEKRRQIEESIRSLEKQRAILGDLVVNSALEALQRQLASLPAEEAGAPAFGGERKLVTVMFADLSGYTAMAEKMDPERAHDLLNQCFEELVPIVEKHGGTIDKFVGDEIMALFGAPVAHENDAERACAASLEMMSALAEFNRREAVDLGLHFGINTGHVVAGEVGTAQRHDYSVMGHAVNLAARLEDASARGEIFVGEQTHRLSAAFFHFEEMTLEVKGASQPVKAFRLLRSRSTPEPSRGLPGRSSPLVGREDELSQLQGLIDALPKGGGAIAALVGDAGIGKSRLIAELRQRVRAMRWHEGRSLLHTQGVSYWLARDLLTDFLGVDEPLQHKPAELLRMSDPAARVLLTHFLKLPLEASEESSIRDLTAEALRRQTFEAFAALIFAAALVEPLILVCEDLHWADASSLELLERLLPITANAPLLLVLVLRNEESAGTHFLIRAARKTGERFHRIELGPLSSAASESLLQNLLQTEEVPPELLQTILTKTEGNAFFLEEVLRSLLDDEVIAFADGHPVLRKPIDKVTVPDTVQGVVAARMDRLPAEEKNALQTGAVLGRIFTEKLLADVIPSGATTDRLHASLESLVTHEFLRRHDGPN
jgi:class 3 adenylate cyclase